MKDIVKYCDDTKETGTLINSNEVPLKQNIEKKKTETLKKSFFKMKKLQKAF